MKTRHNPPTLHRPLASYSHGIQISGTEEWLVLSGQVGIYPDGRTPTDPIEQFETALANIRRNLEAAQMTVSDIVKLTMYLVGDVNAEKRRSVLSEWLAGHEPCMTLLYVAALASPTLRVEVDAIASKDTGRSGTRTK